MARHIGALSAFPGPRYSVGFGRVSVVCGGFSRSPLADLRAYIVFPLRAVLSAALLFPPDIMNYSITTTRYQLTVFTNIVVDIC